MNPLFGVVVASLAGGVASSLFAAFSLALPLSVVNRLVAMAVGAMLAAVFLHILPHAMGMPSGQRIFLWLFLGLLFFFLMEKLVIWRHHHPHEPQAGGHENHHTHHSHAHADSVRESAGWKVALGGAAHCFSDGVLIAAAFLADWKVGLATAIAIVAHAIPQEIGDFIALRQAGWAKREAILVNVGSSLATLVGGLVGFFGLGYARSALPVALGFAAASLLYIAVSDLIPTLHRRPKASDIVEQFALIAFGVALVLVPHEILNIH
jgi:zinc and cadmium transporter